MLALTIVDARGGVEARTFPEPDLQPDRVRVSVRAFSLNRGEARLIRTADVGTRPGWDFAGILIDEVPGRIRKGARVVGVAEGGTWAEKISVRAEWITEIPDAVTYEDAAAVTTAGLTALRTLRLSGAREGSRVLITGASGGVGRFAVQIAAMLGCRISALVSARTNASQIQALGADSVAAELRDLEGPFDQTIESIGGPVLGQVLTALSDTGTVVSFGNSSNQPTTFDVRDFYDGATRTMYGFELFHDPEPFERDLALLMQYLKEGTLNSQIVDILPWEDIRGAAERLERRSLGGKLVLTIDPQARSGDRADKEYGA